MFKEFRMKNTIKVFGIIALVAVIGFSFAALSLTGCSSEDDGNGNGDGSNPFIGTWKDADLTVTCTATTWKATGPGTWSGTYTPNGNSADFIETNGSNFGHATISGNTMTVTSTYGTFYLTKK